MVWQRSRLARRLLRRISRQAASVAGRSRSITQRAQRGLRILGDRRIRLERNRLLQMQRRVGLIFEFAVHHAQVVLHRWSPGWAFTASSSRCVQNRRFPSDSRPRPAYRRYSASSAPCRAICARDSATSAFCLLQHHTAGGNVWPVRCMNQLSMAWTVQPLFRAAASEAGVSR